MGAREYYFDPLAFPPTLIRVIKLQIFNIGVYLIAILAFLVFGGVRSTEPLQATVTILVSIILSLFFYFIRIHILRKRRPWPRLVFTAIVTISTLRALVLFAQNPSALLQTNVWPLALGSALFIAIDLTSIYLLFKPDITHWIKT